MFKKFQLDAIRHLHNRVLFPDPPKRIWGQNKLKSVEEIRLLRLYTGVNIRKPVFSWSLAKEVNFCIFSLV